ncbi:Protein Patched 1 [Manis pentadactyla]|nr:Protein Patched 1 [Manis pentadactyla]
METLVPCRGSRQRKRWIKKGVHTHRPRKPPCPDSTSMQPSECRGCWGLTRLSISKSSTVLWSINLVV